MGEINQRLNDLKITPNTFAHGELTSDYGAANNNYYGPGNNTRPNYPASPNRKINNYPAKPFVPKCTVCGYFMDGIKHNPPGKPCDWVDLNGNLSMTRLSALADKDGSAAVDLISQSPLARSLQDIIKETVSKSVQSMINNELLTTVNTMKSTTTTRA